MATVLIVDDEQGIRDALSDILEDEGYEVRTAADGLVALGMLERETADCMLLDVWLPGRGGLELLTDVRKNYRRMPVIMISGHGTIDMAVRAVKEGAFDFLEKPLSLERVISLVRHALEMEALRRENETLRAQVLGSPVSRLCGTSPAIAAIRKLVEQIAESDARVLVTGDNGTGKELVAREIHQRSRRQEGPFVAVNCAAIPDTLIETELFGHVRGAFTGAEATRAGKFEQAHQGTLFLDEVADMSLAAQAKVLRVIQEMTVQRLGSEEEIVVNVRLIAATNKDIQEEIRHGRFREDLFFRLNVVPLRMPALEERREDIPLLLQDMLQEYRATAPVPRTIVFSEEALEKIMAYPWPGNVRELKNFAERVSIMAVSDAVSGDDVDRLLMRRHEVVRRDLMGNYLHLDLNSAREQFERTYLLEKLREHDFNVARTAQSVGMYPSSLHGKIRKLGIEVGR